MRKVPIALTAALALSVGMACAADNPIAIRKALMDSNAAAAALAGAMLKEEVPYTPAAGKSVIETMHAVSLAYGSFFPDDSRTGDTHASPKIWSNRAGFEKALASFRADTEAAEKAAGDEGPDDLAAFQAAVGPVFRNCKSCHQDFRLR